MGHIKILHHVISFLERDVAGRGRKSKKASYLCSPVGLDVSFFCPSVVDFLSRQFDLGSRQPIKASVLHNDEHGGLLEKDCSQNSGSNLYSIKPYTIASNQKKRQENICRKNLHAEASPSLPPTPVRLTWVRMRKASPSVRTAFELRQSLNLPREDGDYNKLMMMDSS